MIAIRGTPRSVAELRYVAGTRACEACDDRSPIAWTIDAHGPQWIATGRCLHCGSERTYAFEGDRELAKRIPPTGELGGREPSTILDPYDFMREIDRVVPAIVREAGRLAEPGWHANYDRLERVQVALAELAKFGEAIPDSAFRDDNGRADRRARPERYTRAWIDAEAARWRAVATELQRDALRFEHDVPEPLGGFDLEPLAAHREWLALGRPPSSPTNLGPRRFEAIAVSASDEHLDHVDLRGAWLTDVDLARAHLAEAQFDDAELVRTKLDGAQLTGSRFVAALLRECTLAGAHLDVAIFDRMRCERSTFDGARLDMTSWRDAIVEHCSLRDARLAGARLDGAHFEDCDLRGAKLAGAATSRGVWFERCDLRGVDLARRDLSGATFVACKLGGARGAPSAIAGWRVVDIDLSEAGDGSDPAGEDDLLAQLLG